MGVSSISFGSPHVRPMGRTCGAPNETKKNTHPTNVTVRSREQGVATPRGHRFVQGLVTPWLPATHPGNIDEMLRDPLGFPLPNWYCMYAHARGPYDADVQQRKKRELAMAVHTFIHAAAGLDAHTRGTSTSSDLDARFALS